MDKEILNQAHDECKTNLVEKNPEDVYFSKESKSHARTNRRKSRWIIALSISNLFWFGMVLFLFPSLNKHGPSQYTTTAALPTDFSALHTLLTSPLKHTIFDDELTYSQSSDTFSRRLNPNLPQYFGVPSVEIDGAWQTLLAGEFLGVSEEEVALNKELSGPGGFKESDRWEGGKMKVGGKVAGGKGSGYYIALDIFHSLHCLNAVRKELDKSYHPDYNAGNEENREHHGFWADKQQQRIHIDHCLNHIRQSLQCHPDLSPIALKQLRKRDGETFFLGNAKSHTCADWDAIRKWVDGRLEEFGGWGEW